MTDFCIFKLEEKRMDKLSLLCAASKLSINDCRNKSIDGLTTKFNPSVF